MAGALQGLWSTVGWAVGLGPGSTGAGVGKVGGHPLDERLASAATATATATDYRLRHGDHDRGSLGEHEWEIAVARIDHDVEVAEGGLELG